MVVSKEFAFLPLEIRKLNINLTKTVQLGGSIIAFVVQINPGDIEVLRFIGSGCNCRYLVELTKSQRVSHHVPDNEMGD